MTSPARIAANRENAKKSTGPKTEAGKAKVANNASKHGLTAANLVVLPGQEEEFEALKADLMSQFEPQGIVEQLTFNQLLRSAWDLNRFGLLEAALAQQCGADPAMDENKANQLDRLRKYAARSEKSFYRAIKTLEQIRAAQPKLSDLVKLRQYLNDQEDEVLYQTALAASPFLKQQPAKTNPTPPRIPVSEHLIQPRK